MNLYNILKTKAREWRNAHYSSDYPAISEILDFNLNPVRGDLNFLRKAQFEAIETYWYLDIYSFAVELSSLYRLPLMPLYERINNLYPDGEIPEGYAYEIRRQMEEGLKHYDITEEEVVVALALIKHDNFSREEKERQTIYTTEIVYHKDRENLLMKS